MNRGTVLRSNFLCFTHYIAGGSISLGGLEFNEAITLWPHTYERTSSTILHAHIICSQFIIPIVRKCIVEFSSA